MLSPYGNHNYFGEYDLRLEVCDAIVQTALAMYRYHLEKNAWPANLNELTPQYLDTVPLDPYDSTGTAPLRYTNGPLGVRVYSVGRDGKDNGGWCSWDVQDEKESEDTATQSKRKSDDQVFILQPPSK